MKKWRFCSFALIISFVCLSPLQQHSTFAANLYSITDLGALDNNYPNTYAFGLNDLRQVVGASHVYFSDAGSEMRAYKWENGSMINLTPNETSSYGSIASDINNFGQVVGKFPSTSGQIPDGHTKAGHAFIWDEITGLQDLGVLGGYFSSASGINDKGQVVGTTNINEGGSHAFIWDSTNGMKDIGTFGGNSEANSINAKAEVVGGSYDVNSIPHAFIWDETNGMRQLSNSLGNAGSALDINNYSQVVGVYEHPDISGTRGFVWDSRNGMMDIGTLADGPTVARSINDFGEIVGASRLEAVDSSHAILYKNHVLYDLNYLIPQNTGWVLEDAYDINSVGQIVGYGSLNGKEPRGYILDPEWDIFVTESQSAVTDYLTLSDTFSFDYWFEMGIEPTAFNLDILLFRGDHWEVFGAVPNFDGSSEDWATFSMMVPEWAIGHETQIKFCLADWGQVTNPTVYLRNISSDPVPEPATFLLLGSGLIGLVGYSRKKLIKQ